MKHHRINPTLALATAAAVIAALGWLGLYYFSELKLAVLRNSTRELAVVAGAVPEDMAKYLAATADRRAVIHSAFVDGKSLVVFVEAIEALALHTNVTLTLTGAGSEETALAAGMPMNITVEGRFSDVYRFLELEESMPYAVRFDHLFLENDPTATGGWTMRQELTILHYLGTSTPTTTP